MVFFREALLNEEIHSLVYERLSALNLAEDLSPINDISSGVFDFDVALVNGEVPLNTLHELLLGLQSIHTSNISSKSKSRKYYGFL